LDYKYRFILNAKFDIEIVDGKMNAVLISGTDITKYYLRNSISIKLSNDYKNSFSARFNINPSEINLYQEITVLESYNDRNLFSGIISSIKPIRVAPHDFIFEVRSEGYQMIFENRTFEGVIAEAYTGKIVRDIVYDWMTNEGANPEFSENIRIGLWQNGLLAINYDMIASSSSKIIDDLAKANGFKWWLSNYKVFYFIDIDLLYNTNKQGSLSQEDKDLIESMELFNPLEIDEDLTNERRLNNVQNLELEYTIDKYRNKQTIIGNMTGGAKIRANTFDSTERDRLKIVNPNLSGVVGAVVTNSDIDLIEDAQGLATKYVKAYNSEQVNISFSTFNPTFAPLQIFQAKYPSAGLEEQTTFVIDSISIVDTGIYDTSNENYEFLYSIKAHAVDLEKPVLPQSNWKQRFYDFVNSKLTSNPDSRTSGSVISRDSEDSYIKTSEEVIDSFSIIDN